MFKVILWDIDNTILNFNAAEKAALTKEFLEFNFGELTDEMLAVYTEINHKMWQALERGEMSKPQILVGRFEKFFGMYGLDIDQASAFNERYQELLGETICFNDNAYEIITDLKGKVLQCAASNGTKKAQTGKLKNSGLDQLFDLIFISEDIGAEKPSVEFFDKSFEDIKAYFKENKMNSNAETDGESFDKEEVIIIGDSLTSDIKGANNAGIKSCWYNPNGLVNDKGVSVDYEIKDLHEIYDILANA